jgi:hypothetical protein
MLAVGMVGLVVTAPLPKLVVAEVLAAMLEMVVMVRSVEMEATVRQIAELLAGVLLEAVETEPVLAVV